MDVKKPARYVFGPVPSRRLGRSLGVNLAPFKTCTFDCIYCQLGRTTNQTLCRRLYVPVADLLAEVERKLRHHRPDFVTLSGSGEPTLHSQLGLIISEIKKLTLIPVAVLTNGSLLSESDVRAACAQADVVMPSLDAATASIFRRINRPCLDILFSRVVQGLTAFRQEFGGRLWLEVFLVQGVNDEVAHALKLRDLLAPMRADRIHLNTVARPPAEPHVRAVPLDQMQHIQSILGPTAEVIADFHEEEPDTAASATEDDLLALLRRRPCTLSDIAAGLALHPNEAVKRLDGLLRRNLVTASGSDGKQYFLVRS
ncbi:MAG: radical SAM protein [Planctomycetes bacterium]|nr:radical SAM protein [Planctomycetota bacterium]MBM4079000.1 radical SAM protein [Planctomycetota bacterium]MBM4085264.1 radical SAM protein [Planctomycetota bacterium]